MKLRIYKTVQCHDPKLGQYKNYKIFINRTPIWISEMDFAKHAGLLQVSKNYIELGSYAQRRFKMVPKQNSKGTFLTLEPRDMNETIYGTENLNWQTDIKFFEIENSKSVKKKDTSEVTSGNVQEQIKEILKDIDLNVFYHDLMGKMPVNTSGSEAFRFFSSALIGEIPALNIVNEIDISKFIAIHFIDGTIACHYKFAKEFNKEVVEYAKEFLEKNNKSSEKSENTSISYIEKEIEAALANENDIYSKILDRIPEGLDVRNSFEFFHVGAQYIVPALALVDRDEFLIYVAKRLIDGTMFHEAPFHNELVEYAKQYLIDNKINETPVEASPSRGKVKLSIEEIKKLWGKTENQDRKSIKDSLNNEFKEPDFEYLDVYVDKNNDQTANHKDLVQNPETTSKNIEAETGLKSLPDKLELDPDKFDGDLTKEDVKELIEVKPNDKGVPITVEVVDFFGNDAIEVTTDQSNDPKMQFISGLINLAAKEQVDNKTRDRFFTLVSRELNRKNAIENTILTEITNLRDLLTKETTGDEPTTNPKESKLPHKPRNTTDFLRLFSFADGSGFKELVHDTNLEVFTPNMIIEKTTHHPNFCYDYYKTKSKDFNPIHAPVQAATKELIEKFKANGFDFIAKHQKHPYEAEKDYTALALRFKCNCRFGSGREYTNLAEAITNIAYDQKYNKSFKADNLVFIPDRRKFEIRSNFYTWVPSVKIGLKFIFDGIKDHGNIEAEMNYLADEKRIEIECWKKTKTENAVFISIFDISTIANSKHNNAFKKLRESAIRLRNFWSLCDWYIEADFIDGSYRFEILGSEKDESDCISKLDQKVGGFKHILKFYDYE